MSSPAAEERPRSVERALVVVGAAVIGLAGLKLASGVVAPMIFAFVAAVTAYPLQRRIMDRGHSKLLALLVMWGAIYLVFVVAFLMLALSVETLAKELPQYDQQLQDAANKVSKALGGDGSSDWTKNVSGTQVASAASKALGDVMSILGNGVVVIAVIFFLVIDALQFPDKLRQIAGERGHVTAAWTDWASQTRRYLGVATIFGVIVAVCDGVLLWVLGVPMIAVWVMLAFVTNYIPNIGFVLGVIPPAIIAGLAIGWSTALWVVVGYCLINFTIQEFIQPKIIGDSVNLSAAITFVSVIFWTWLIGAPGAILCIPLTLFVRTVMLQPYDDSRWLSDLISASVGTGVERLADPEEDAAGDGGAGPDPAPSAAG